MNQTALVSPSPSASSAPIVKPADTSRDWLSMDQAVLLTIFVIAMVILLFLAVVWVYWSHKHEVPNDDADALYFQWEAEADDDGAGEAEPPALPELEEEEDELWLPDPYYYPEDYTGEGSDAPPDEDDEEDNLELVEWTGNRGETRLTRIAQGAGERGTHLSRIALCVRGVHGVCRVRARCVVCACADSYCNVRRVRSDVDKAPAGLHESHVPDGSETEAKRVDTLGDVGGQEEGTAGQGVDQHPKPELFEAWPGVRWWRKKRGGVESEGCGKLFFLNITYFISTRPRSPLLRLGRDQQGEEGINEKNVALTSKQALLYVSSGFVFTYTTSFSSSSSMWSVSSTEFMNRSTSFVLGRWR